MKKSNVTELCDRVEDTDPLTGMLRAGARELIHHAVDAELEELLAEHGERKTTTGTAEVVRNGYHPERDIQTGIGPVTVKIPKVRAKSGEPVSFRSARVPPYVRKSRSLEAALPWLYLKGVSSGEMSEALSMLVGPQAIRIISQHGVAAETRLVRAAPSVAHTSAGCISGQTGFTAACAVITTSCVVW